MFPLFVSASSKQTNMVQKKKVNQMTVVLLLRFGISMLGKIFGATLASQCSPNKCCGELFVSCGFAFDQLEAHTLDAESWRRHWGGKAADAMVVRWLRNVDIAPFEMHLLLWVWKNGLRESFLVHRNWISLSFLTSVAFGAH